MAGTVTPPPSKSHAQRLLAAALIQRGVTTIKGIGTSDDEQAALNIIRQLGGNVQASDDGTVTVESTGIAAIEDYIDCGESGLATRLFTPIAALSNQRNVVEVRGSGSLLHRPMDEFAIILPQLGVELEGFNGRLPIRMRAGLEPRSLQLNGEVSSQYLSGVLFALTHAVSDEPVRIEVHAPTSRPYIAMSLEVLSRFGWPILHHDFRSFLIDPSLFKGVGEENIRAEKDWSAAAALLIAASIHQGGDLSVDGLSPHSLQADIAVLHVLHQCGVPFMWNRNSLYANPYSEPLHPFHFDCTECPDLIPVLSILAACCAGKSSIHGLQRLSHKESDRAATVSEMLIGFGVSHVRKQNTFIIEGQLSLKACTVQSHNDHRIVMAAAIAALRADGPVTIEGAEAVRKSYPDFFQDLQKLGVQVELTQ